MARGWADSLSGNGRLLDSKAPDAQLTRGPNRYYLQGQRQGCFGSYSVTKGPFTLPRGAQVSNSHFSDADVLALQREANQPRIVWPPLPPLPPVALY